MGFFLRAVFVLVALANLYVPVAALAAVSDPAAMSCIARLSIQPSVILAGVVPGLLVAEVLLRLMRPALEGKFLCRYVVIVLGVCLGEVLMGALMGLFFLGATLQRLLGPAVLG